MNFLAPVTGLISVFAAAPMLFIGIAVGILGYRYLLIKNPNLLNTLVTKAKTDIDDLESLITKKKAVLPTATIAPVVAPVVAVEPIAAPVVVAPVAAPVAVAPVAVAPVAVAPVAAPVAPAA